jgi:pimeloyl-ACP methyl ester carboxylesterase
MNRRTFVKHGTLTSTVLAATFLGRSWGQGEITPFHRQIETAPLTIGYEESGNSAGFPIVLLHGFPDDVRAWDEVAPPLVKAGYRVLVPYLRGYGPTRFRDAVVQPAQPNHNEDRNATKSVKSCPLKPRANRNS